MIVILKRSTSVPLICIKAPRYSVRELVTPTPSIALPSMQEAVKSQSEFLQDQARSPTDYSKSMGDSALKAATGPLPQRTEVGCKVERRSMAILSVLPSEGGRWRFNS